MKASECPFKIGQKVKHKASGEVGIVTDIHSQCLKHTASEHIAMNMARLRGVSHGMGDCESKFVGSVSLSVGFQGNDIDVDVFLLEPCS